MIVRLGRFLAYFPPNRGLVGELVETLSYWLLNNHFQGHRVEDLDQRAGDRKGGSTRTASFWKARLL